VGYTCDWRDAGDCGASSMHFSRAGLVGRWRSRTSRLLHAEECRRIRNGESAARLLAKRRSKTSYSRGRLALVANHALVER
jgi:hypothetical protein